ncbi:hypothetical protein BH11PSE8_BH11PSE8_07890 [soil metagenome]
MTTTIDHNTLARLVEADAVRAAHIVGRPGGWGVVVEYGSTERSLAATRSKEARVFKRFETLVGYLKGIGIVRFDVDTANFDESTGKTYRRPDTSATLKQAHAALAHDRWFQEQVAGAIDQANDPATAWVSNETAMADSAERRAAWRAGAALRKP